MSARLRRARIAASAWPSLACAGAAKWTLPVATTPRSASAASRASMSLRSSSPGSCWQVSSTITFSCPNIPVSAASSRQAASGPPAASAAGTGPLRHPVSTTQWPSCAAASSPMS